MKKAIITLVLLSALLMGCQSKIQECPDQWYINAMPGPGAGGPDREYFVIDGERAEINDFDVDWIEKNCDIEPMVVQ